MTRFSHAVPIEFSKMSLLKNFGWNFAENPNELYQLHDLPKASPERDVFREQQFLLQNPLLFFPVFIHMPSKEHEGWFHSRWSNTNMEVPQVLQ